ncbi:class I SAM-dependent methyltransferase [Saccharibacillus sp. CPCC 101409]|uniref:class I SAM-dependent methyltransferase n=1 Tax=Saccharibacillus sp. CPCC 101409 TaxID=3058041 RepID=UPI002672B52E|nr:class I SAM-dependent methyltransferase [Saccharibacillus sp. CPCC 101409]MDO3411240.1 class I SAM-dependent methyltransferase [Saccharibacillus sp. CPCC 101409]
MLEHVRKNNVERFKGFGSLYDRNRPAAPEEVVRILEMYLGEPPQTVVDVGCGTGLSTFLWLDRAEQIVGIEPSPDMRGVAEEKWRAAGSPDKLSFREGYSDDLELPDGSADLITCSQSFHWMDPQPSLAEFSRVLRPGGVFAAYDCDWPPVLNEEIEAAYLALNERSDRRAAELSPEREQAHKRSKDEHLRQIRDSGLFRYSREIVFHNWEVCDAERYTSIALSQGGHQTAIKRGAQDVADMAEEFRRQADEFFGGEAKDMLFSYRMRLGVK